MSSTQGWTTGDPASITVWEHLPSGLRCQLVLQDAEGREITPSNWMPLEEYLPDEQGHSLAHLRVMVDSGAVELECGGVGDVGACRIQQITGSVQAHWEVQGATDRWQVNQQANEIALAPQGTALPQDIAGFLDTQLRVARQALPHGDGALQAPLEAMATVLAANTIQLPQTGDVITVSRHLLAERGEWVIPNWQTFLTALATAYLDGELAVASSLTALRQLAVSNMLAAEATFTGPQRDLSNPPVASYCLWKIFQITGDFSVLNESYDILLRWHNWWGNFRDGNHSQLLNWVSDVEAGMPGHPLYAEATPDEQTGVLQLDDVGLSSLLALDAFALMRMALQLNDLDTATHLEQEISTIADRVNMLLWDGTRQDFFSHDWQGVPIMRQSATVLLTLIGGIIKRNRVPRFLSDRLEVEFAAPYLVPTMGVGDPAFAEQQPWAGRVSPLLNLLICEGLRLFGKDEQAETIIQSGLELLQNGWLHDHRVFESYNALTGHGDDIAQDTLSPAGMCFGALGIGMLLDVEPWDGMRIGNLSGTEMAVHGVQINGVSYDVQSSQLGIIVSRNGARWLQTDRPVILRNFLETPHEFSVQAKVAFPTDVTLCVCGYQPGQQISVRVNGQVSPVIANDNGEVIHSAHVFPPPDTGGPYRASA